MRRFGRASSEEDGEEEDTTSLSSSTSNSGSEEDSNNVAVGAVSPALGPPEYSEVLLENLSTLDRRHPGFLPHELSVAVRSLLRQVACTHRDGETTSNNPYRTLHTLSGDRFIDGAGTYVGELDPKSRRHGLGHMVYSATDDRYTGGWFKGARHGQGAYFWADSGSVYAGGWLRGERCGRGHFVFGERRGQLVAKGVVYSGLWCRGRIRGPTEVAFVSADGEVCRVLDDSARDRRHLAEGGDDLVNLFKSIFRGNSSNNLCLSCAKQKRQ